MSTAKAKDFNRKERGENQNREHKDRLGLFGSNGSEYSLLVASFLVPQRSLRDLCDLRG